ncbi:MAG: hypothetical protein WCO76_09165 [Planctomycetota bacterium]
MTLFVSLPRAIVIDSPFVTNPEAGSVKFELLLLRKITLLTPLMAPAEPVSVTVPDPVVLELPITVALVRALRISIAPTLTFPVLRLIPAVVVELPVKPNWATSVAVGTVPLLQLAGVFQAPELLDVFHVTFAAMPWCIDTITTAMLTRLVATVRAKRLTSQLMDELRGVVVAEAFFVVLFNARPSMPVGIFVRSMIPPCDRAHTVRHPVATIER